jgi:hypothetical protein
MIPMNYMKSVAQICEVRKWCLPWLRRGGNGELLFNGFGVSVWKKF